MSPRKANTFKKVLSLKTDGHSTKAYWIQIGEHHVSLTKQKIGEDLTEKIWEIPKRDFNALIDWYNKEQKASPSKH